MAQDCTIATVPRRFAAPGDLHKGIDGAVFWLDTPKTPLRWSPAKLLPTFRRFPTHPVTVPSMARRRERSPPSARREASWTGETERTSYALRLSGAYRPPSDPPRRFVRSGEHPLS
jgi:hypothetical protein